MSRFPVPRSACVQKERMLSTDSKLVHRGKILHVLNAEVNLSSNRMHRMILIKLSHEYQHDAENTKAKRRGTDGWYIHAGLQAKRRSERTRRVALSIARQRPS
jgi:hypothetical protein